jgi:hypothetical protein
MRSQRHLRKTTIEIAEICEIAEIAEICEIAEIAEICDRNIDPRSRDLFIPAYIVMSHGSWLLHLSRYFFARIAFISTFFVKLKRHLKHIKSFQSFFASLGFCFVSRSAFSLAFLKSI